MHTSKRPSLVPTQTDILYEVGVPDDGHPTGTPAGGEMFV